VIAWQFKSQPLFLSNSCPSILPANKSIADRHPCKVACGNLKKVTSLAPVRAAARTLRHRQTVAVSFGGAANQKEIKDKQQISILELFPALPSTLMSDLRDATSNQ
jgi:hypothetical protein